MSTGVDTDDVWADGVGRAIYGDAWPGDFASGLDDLLPLLQMDGAVMCVGSHREGYPDGQGRVMCPACGSMLNVESATSPRVLPHWRWTVGHLVEGAESAIPDRRTMT